MKKSLIYILGALLIALTSCFKDDYSVSETTISEGPSTTIETGVSGLVTSQDGTPLENVSVQYRGDYLVTDENGYFQFNNVNAVFDGGLLKFEESGYFKNYKWFYPQVGETSFVRVMMIPESRVGTVSAADGGVVELNGGAKVTFPQNAFEGLESGEVNIYGHWYNPLGGNLAEEMPGDLRGIDADNNLVQLATYGMVGVELRDNSGNELQLREGASATIEFPLPDGLDQLASETIPTWSFDEDRAYWIEEGMATLSEGKYIAEVSHFSFWNCDAPFPVVHINGRLVDSNNNPLGQIKMCITDLSRSNTRMGWTSSDGTFSGKIPKGEALKLEIKSGCGGLLYQGEIGPFDADIDLGDIIIDNDRFIDVTGRLVCDGQPVSNGYALLSTQEGLQYVAGTNDEGYYNLTIPHCELNKLSIKGYDRDNLVSSEWNIFEDLIRGELALNDIEVCDGGNLEDEYIRMKFDGENEVLILEVAAVLTNGVLDLSGETQQGDYALIRINNPELGTNNEIQLINAGRSQLEIFGQCGDGENTICTSVTVDLTAVDLTVGGYIEGTFMGTIDEEVTGSVDIMGDFRIKVAGIRNVSTVSGTCWVDTNQNGIREADETDAIPPFTVVNVSSTNLTMSVQLDDLGRFEMLLDMDNYQISVPKPAGYSFSPQDVGSDDTIDSDVNENGLVQLTVDGMTSYVIDIGIYFDDSFDCELFSTNPGCDQSTGSYQVFLNTQDSLNWDGFVLNTYLDGMLIAESNYTPWTRIEELGVGNYSYELIDPSGDVICNEDFVMEDSGQLNCEIYPFSFCEGDYLYVGVEVGCNAQSLTYLWSNGSTQSFLDNVSPGTYSLTITDNTGCSQTTDVEVVAQPITVAGIVWEDNPIYLNNAYDRNLESGLANVTVHVYNPSDSSTPLYTTVTDNEGQYDIVVNPYSDYILGIELPSGYVLVEKDHPDATLQKPPSSLDPTTRVSDLFTVQECGRIIMYIGLKPE